MLWEEEILFSDRTRVLREAVKTGGTKRLVAVMGFGAGRFKKNAMSLIEQTGHCAILGKHYADTDRQEAMIVDSDLDWTIAWPVILTNGAKSNGPETLCDPSTWRNGLVSRRDVARYFVEAVEDGMVINADVVVTR